MPNVKWRAKTLPLEQWTTLQNSFGDFQLAAGCPVDLAMFSVNNPGSNDSTIYLVGPGIAAIEALSPGGWEDAEAPSSKGTALLVGTGNSRAYFGLNNDI
jgi:hypothetical protein